MDAFELGGMGLDNINWNRFYHAYGIATDTLGHLQNLFNSDFTQRHNAIEHLFGAVLHQGTIYTVTPIVVKMLITILNHPALREDMGEFYKEKYSSQLIQTKKKMNSPDTTPVFAKALLHRCTQLEEVLKSQDGNNGLVQVLSFLGSVGESLLFNEAPADSDEVFDLLGMADDVLAMVSPLVSDENSAVAQTAKSVVTNWTKAKQGGVNFGAK
jgi:hypothetical protein